MNYIIYLKYKNYLFIISTVKILVIEIKALLRFFNLLEKVIYTIQKIT